MIISDAKNRKDKEMEKHDTEETNEYVPRTISIGGYTPIPIVEMAEPEDDDIEEPDKVK